MTALTVTGTFPLGDRTVSCVGYGAMQLARPGVFGQPKDWNAALTVLRRGRERCRSHQHQRLPLPSHHQSADPRSAPSLVIGERNTD